MTGRLFALALLLAGACSRGSAFTVRPEPPGPAPAPGPVSFRALHVADFGDDTRQQAAVAAAMAAAARAAPVDLVLHPGDNIYECGVNPSLPGAEACAFAPDQNTVPPGTALPADPSFQKLFEKPLDGVLRDGKPVPVLLTLGNHDVAASGGCAGGGEARIIARRKACLQVAHRSPRWSMPGRHWVEDRGPVRFIGIDSNLLKRDYGDFSFDDEVAFVAGAAAPCKEKLCFIVAHHPSFSAGEHRADATPQYLERVSRIEAAAGPIAGWLAGHEHQLEQLRAPAGYDVIISGNGSRARPEERFSSVSAPGARLLFASTSPGFGILEVGAGGSWSYRFIDDQGRPVQCCASVSRGPCKPVTCPP
ncbi:MAG: metallophosphoesterase [Deltaproteobacteria bacterium]